MSLSCTTTVCSGAQCSPYIYIQRMGRWGLLPFDKFTPISRYATGLPSIFSEAFSVYQIELLCCIHFLLLAHDPCFIYVLGLKWRNTTCIGKVLGSNLCWDQTVLVVVFVVLPRCLRMGPLLSESFPDYLHPDLPFYPSFSPFRIFISFHPFTRIALLSFQFVDAVTICTVFRLSPRSTRDPPSFGIVSNSRNLGSIDPWRWDQ
jgi:hypothetical protein